MNDLGPALFYIFVTTVVIIGVFVVTRQRIDAIKTGARKAGLVDVRANFWLRVVGSWRGYNATFEVPSGGRGGPERAIVEIAAGAPARLWICVRPPRNVVIIPFGPPVVQTAIDAEYLVCSDDPMLAERLLGDAKFGAELRSTICGRRDVLKLGARSVRVIRAVGGTSIDEAVRQAWQLASTVVEQLGLRPVGSG